MEPFAGMPRRLLACTPSRLASFDCPRRYRYTYLDRPAPPRGRPWAHNTVGAAVHLALARWWALPPRERTPDHGRRLLERGWQSDGFRDAAQALRWRGIAAGWVERYLAEVDPAAEPIGVERTVAVSTERLALSGRIDRLDDRLVDGPVRELVVVDYKAGRHRSSVDDARGSQALALYVLAVRRTLRRACNRVELHHVPSGAVAGFEHTDASLRHHLARAEATADDIEQSTAALRAGADADRAFPAVPGPSCSWCDFRSRCAPGRAASPVREPWAGLDEPDSGAPAA